MTDAGRIETFRPSTRRLRCKDRVRGGARKRRLQAIFQAQHEVGERWTMHDRTNAGTHAPIVHSSIRAFSCMLASRSQRHKATAALRRGIGARRHRAHDFGGDERVPGVVWMEAVGRIVRRDVRARVAHQIDDDHALRHERVDHRRRHAHGGLLRRLALRQRRACKKGKARQVGHVEHDDPRRAGASPDPVHEHCVIGSEGFHLAVDVAGLITGARAGAERRRDGVDLVAAGKDCHERRVRSNERHLVHDEIADDDPVVLLAEQLEIRADHRGRNAEICQRDVEALSHQLPRRDLGIPHAVRASCEGNALDARSHAVGVAGSHRVIHDRGPRCRWTAGGSGVIVTQA